MRWLRFFKGSRGFVTYGGMDDFEKGKGGVVRLKNKGLGLIFAKRKI